MSYAYTQKNPTDRLEALSSTPASHRISLNWMKIWNPGGELGWKSFITVTASISLPNVCLLEFFCVRVCMCVCMCGSIWPGSRSMKCPPDSSEAPPKGKSCLPQNNKMIFSASERRQREKELLYSSLKTSHRDALVWCPRCMFVYLSMSLWAFWIPLIILILWRSGKEKKQNKAANKVAFLTRNNTLPP